jgi:hypothetical protein
VQAEEIERIEQGRLSIAWPLRRRGSSGPAVGLVRDPQALPFQFGDVQEARQQCGFVTADCVQLHRGFRGLACPSARHSMADIDKGAIVQNLREYKC